MNSWRFAFGVIILCTISQVRSVDKRRPCKFGDKIEYGHLGKEVKLGDGLDAYVSHPNGTESKGGVIVIHGITGWALSNTRAMVDMLMENNFTAIMPDSFEGKPAWNHSQGWENFGLFADERPAGGVGKVVNASLEYLKNQYGIEKSAMVGFCWGGQAVHYMMATRDDIVAGVSFYGMMPEDDKDFGKLNNPTLFIYGKADRLFNKKRIRGLRRALKSKGSIGYSIRGYKNQPHGFAHSKLTSPDDPNKDQIYAARKKMIRWLNRHLATE